MEINLTYRDFDTLIGTGNKFLTTERGNNLLALIAKWNEYISNGSMDKRLAVKFIEFSDALMIDMVFNNMDIGEIRLGILSGGLYLYLNNSTVDNLIFNDHQNLLKEKVIQGDSGDLSHIKILEFENIHFTAEDNNSLIIANLNIEQFLLIRTVNLSQKVQVFGCTIKNLIVSASDLGRMTFIQNGILNLYITASVVYKAILLSNKIGRVHPKYFRRIEDFPKALITLPSEIMIDVSRQLKNAFDESKNFTDGDRFYADEMLYTLKAKYFLNPLLILHWISSRFGTSWIRASIFIIVLGFVKLYLTRNLAGISSQEIIVGIINNINPYINFQEAKLSTMGPWHFLYLILLAYGVYEFILSVRRISKR